MSDGKLEAGFTSRACPSHRRRFASIANCRSAATPDFGAPWVDGPNLDSVQISITVKSLP